MTKFNKGFFVKRRDSERVGRIEFKLVTKVEIRWCDTFETEYVSNSELEVVSAQVIDMLEYRARLKDKRAA